MKTLCFFNPIVNHLRLYAQIKTEGVVEWFGYFLWFLSKDIYKFYYDSLYDNVLLFLPIA